MTVQSDSAVPRHRELNECLTQRPRYHPSAWQTARIIHSDPERRDSSEVRILRLPPADRMVPAFAEEVGGVSVLVPSRGGRRLRHRASLLLERIDGVHPHASLSLIVTDADVIRAPSASALILEQGRQVPWREDDDRRDGWVPAPRRSPDEIFIR